MKKVTIHDVAREAGVSAATVSYVINNRTDQAISEETKEKVWHIVNMLNYKPSIYAKSLRASPESKLVAICSDCSNELSRAEFFHVLIGMEAALEPSYSLVFSADPFKRFTNADCIVAVGFSKESFYDIGKSNYIPLIAVDSFIGDKLFFQVNTDLCELKKAADAHFEGDYLPVFITPNDCGLKMKIKSIFPSAYFSNNFRDLEEISCTNVLTPSNTVAQYLFSKGANVYLAEDFEKRKFAKTGDCIGLALSHEQFDIHAYEV